MSVIKNANEIKLNNLFDKGKSLVENKDAIKEFFKLLLKNDYEEWKRFEIKSGHVSPSFEQWIKELETVVDDWEDLYSYLQFESDAWQRYGFDEYAVENFWSDELDEFLTNNFEDITKEDIQNDDFEIEEFLSAACATKVDVMADYLAYGDFSVSEQYGFKFLERIRKECIKELKKEYQFTEEQINKTNNHKEVSNMSNNNYNLNSLSLDIKPNDFDLVVDILYKDMNISLSRGLSFDHDHLQEWDENSDLREELGIKGEVFSFIWNELHKTNTFILDSFSHEEYDEFQKVFKQSECFKNGKFEALYAELNKTNQSQELLTGVQQ